MGVPVDAHCCNESKFLSSPLPQTLGSSGKLNNTRNSFEPLNWLIPSFIFERLFRGSNLIKLASFRIIWVTFYQCRLHFEPGLVPPPLAKASKIEPSHYRSEWWVGSATRILFDFQGASSTLLAVAVMASMPSYILQSFTKVPIVLLSFLIFRLYLLIELFWSLHSVSGCRFVTFGFSKSLCRAVVVWQ